MSEFGDNMKGLMAGLENGLTGRKEIVKKEKKRTVYEYEAEVSGIDAIITYKVSGKEKMKLILFLSQKDENGNPVCFIQEKGQNIHADEDTLKSFFNGLSHSDCFAEGEWKVRDKNTGAICESVPVLHKTNSDLRFIKCLLLLISNKYLADHVRQGLINLEIIYMYVDDKENNRWREHTCPPWFFKDRDMYGYHLYEISGFYSPEYKEVYDRDKDEYVRQPTGKLSGINEDNLHIKLFKAAMKIAMENGGGNKFDVLMSLYGNRSAEGEPGRKKLTMDTLRTFILLANRYDEPFAIKCMEDYMTNPKLSKLTVGELNNLFLINVDEYERGRGNFNNGGYRSYTTYHGNLALTPIDDAMKDKLLNLEKNRFWEYILQASCVGLGKNLANYIQLWTDYITSCYLYFGKVPDKYPEHLQEVHDIMVDKYSTYSEFRKDDLLKKMTVDAAKYCDMHNDEYQFKIFTTVKEYLDEATQQGNCLASSDYAGKTADGRCWVGSFRVRNSEDALITVELNPKTGKMVQIKARYNRDPEVKYLKVLKTFQDKIYKRMMEAGVITQPDGYNYAFDPVLNKF